MPDKDELAQLWSSQRAGPETKGEDMLVMAMKRVNRFDRTIKLRNWRESIAGVVVTIWFAWIAWRSPNGLTRAGNALVAASGLWYVFCMWRYGHEARPSAPDRSLADYQRALLRKYDYQIRLLKNVKYWYLLPPYAGLLLASAGILMDDAAKGHPASPQWVAMAIYTAVFAAVWWLNEAYAVRKLSRARAGLLEQMNHTEGEER
jgi:hypothetical protein